MTQENTRSGQRLPSALVAILFKPQYMTTACLHCQVIGGFMVPVHDAYGKKSLAPQQHRMKMAELATESSKWLTMDPWECEQEGWTRTALSLQRLAESVRGVEVRCYSC
jgi:nicotinic acid mononucleotide adenylyltransferase